MPCLNLGYFLSLSPKSISVRRKLTWLCKAVSDLCRLTSYLLHLQISALSLIPESAPQSPAANSHPAHCLSSANGGVSPYWEHPGSSPALPTSCPLPNPAQPSRPVAVPTAGYAMPPQPRSSEGTAAVRLGLWPGETEVGEAPGPEDPQHRLPVPVPSSSQPSTRVLAQHSLPPANACRNSFLFLTCPSLKAQKCSLALLQSHPCFWRALSRAACPCWPGWLLLVPSPCSPQGPDLVVLL